MLAVLLLALAQEANLNDLPADLEIPPVTKGAPAPGKRTRAALPAYAGTDVHHLLYLPTDWKKGSRYPVIVEYAGNGGYKNARGDVSLGTVEGSRLGYGLSGGRGFLWLCLPYVNVKEKRNQEKWWGDVDATVAYCREAVRTVCRDFGGDPDRLVLAGFSRGAIACNYIGLHDDGIAKLWRAFVAHSHYDGVRRWGYPGDDRESALRRLKRLDRRPQWISHERSTRETRRYLESTGITGDFTYCDLPFPNHTDAWVLRDLPARRKLRAWLRRALE